MQRKDVLGKFGERVAERYLVDQGLQIVATNWRCARGELDIVALDDRCLVFCEVKTRSSLRYGSPIEAITPVKLSRVRLLAVAWLAEQEAGWSRFRFDVIGVLADGRSPPRVRHLRNVV